MLGVSTVDKIAIELDVSSIAPDGCRIIAADLFASPSLEPSPVLWVCVPGGGINRRYYDLDVVGQSGSYSMARQLASDGSLVLCLDPPAIGDSDSPDDGYALSPGVVARVLAEGLNQFQIQMAEQERLREVSAPPRAIIGLGHSAGALLTVCQQAHHRSFDALALLGFSACGLPGVLNERELAYAGMPEKLSKDLATLTEARFGEPLPQWSNSSAGEIDTDADAVAVDRALAEATSPLLALVGMTAIVPGSVQPELDLVDVPTFMALGERDLAGSLRVLPTQVPNCGDLTLYLVKQAGHSHNIAANRLTLWRRLMQWATSVAPVRP